MNKTLTKVLIGLAALAVIIFFGLQYMDNNNRTASPPATATGVINGANIEVKYSQPSKKNREIFGKLVPFGQVWRTGANEATVFTTDRALTIGGKSLPAGTYTLWTKPEKDNWTVMFNRGEYMWGVSLGNKPSYDPLQDALTVVVPTQSSDSEVEKFTISLVEQPASALVFAWDATKVSVLIQ